MQFLQILAVREVPVTLTERFASPKALQANIMSHSMFLVIASVDLVIVRHFLSIKLQFVPGLKLFSNFGLRPALCDHALAIARMVGHGRC